MEKRVLGKTDRRSSILPLRYVIFIYPVEETKEAVFVKYILEEQQELYESLRIQALFQRS